MPYELQLTSEVDRENSTDDINGEAMIVTMSLRFRPTNEELGAKKLELPPNLTAQFEMIPEQERARILDWAANLVERHLEQG